MSLPVYTSGCFELYRIKTDETKDFPEDILENQHMTIWYNEISVYDHTRYALSQSGREITMKIRIPQYKNGCICFRENLRYRHPPAINEHRSRGSGVPGRYACKSERG